MEPPWQPPGPFDVLITLLQLAGVPVVVLSIILTINVITDWVRFGVGTARIGSNIARGIGASAREGWAAAATPATRRLGWVFVALLTQSAWVLLLYLGCRMVIHLPVDFDSGTKGSGWERYFLAVVSFPTESPPWTGWVALGGIGLLAALDIALVLHWELNVKVIVVVIYTTVPAGGLAALVFGIGGGLITAATLIFLVLGGLWGGGAAASVAPWVLTWFIVFLIGVLGYTVLVLMNLIIRVSSRALWPSFDAESWTIGGR